MSIVAHPPGQQIVNFKLFLTNLLSKQYLLIFDWSSWKSYMQKIESLNLQFAVFDLVNLMHISRLAKTKSSICELEDNNFHRNVFCWI